MARDAAPDPPYPIHTEGAARFAAPVGPVLSKGQPAFYNPQNTLQRDLAVAVLNAFAHIERVAEPMTGVGVRAIRFLLERAPRPFVVMADLNPTALLLARSNLTLNDIPPNQYLIEQSDAAVSLLRHAPFDFVDLDPFGSPAPLLDVAVSSVRMNGIIGAGATDLAALLGKAPQACHRRYWSHPIRTPFSRELAVRILIRRAQLAAATHDRALVPVLSHAEAHYVRVYLHFVGGAARIEQLLAKHQYVAVCRTCESYWVTDAGTAHCHHCNEAAVVAGPMWTGDLWDRDLLDRLVVQSRAPRALLMRFIVEAEVGGVGFYDIDRLARRARRDAPSFARIIAALADRGHRASRTHFSPRGLRTTAPLDVILAMMSQHRGT